MKKGENRHRLLPFPFEIWSGRRVSNSRPQPWQGCALPTELLPHLWRREAESNRRERICNPVHSHFAIAPFSWSGRRVSNSRPQPWQGCALPTELLPQLRRRIIRGFLELSRARNQKVYFFASLSQLARTPRTYQPTDQRLSPCGSCNLGRSAVSEVCASSKHLKRHLYRRRLSGRATTKMPSRYVDTNVRTSCGASPGSKKQKPPVRRSGACD